MEKKEFILISLLPYFKDRSLCGMNPATDDCMYLTPEGKMCAIGQWLIDPKAMNELDVFTIIGIDQRTLKPEARGILSFMEWTAMQSVHDTWANNYPDSGEELGLSIRELEYQTNLELVELYDAAGLKPLLEEA